jgi:putative SOS response-associated peptidase YedK
MCFYAAQNQPREAVEERFNATVDNPDKFLQSEYIVGFEYLNMPIILDKSPEIISTNYHWGLVPAWAKDIEFRKNTLNCRLDTIDEKASFRNINNNRCLVIASSFFEWRHENGGKTKIKYQIHNADKESFAFAGLYETWENKSTGESYNSFSVVTTDADEQMSYIHNHKKRMPIMLNFGDESAWLDSTSSKVHDFGFPNYQPRLIGFPI